MPGRGQLTVHDRHLITERRLERFLRERIRPARYGATAPFTVTSYHVPGEPIPFDEALLALADGAFEPFAIGASYGAPWSTTWFHCRATVPQEWAGTTVEARIDLGFGLAPGFQAEGLVWGPSGPLRALNPLNHAIPLMPAARGGEEFEFLVEAAANPMVGPSYVATPLGDPATLPATHLYALKRAELSVFHPDVAALVHDLDVLGGLIQELPLNAPRRPQITVAIERALDALDLTDVPGTAAAARSELADVLASPAVPSAHRITAIGHAHIDTAWLWPLRETVRKCARTFSNVLDLMTREPDLVFACSQAQQHDWMRVHYPTVFERMKQEVAAGRFVPVGGMWVESDTNLPSGESLARQFLHGQRFFEEQYGTTCTEVWIPDVFGYPASLPQIFRLGGATRFLTQKLSWNKQNRMPHHTFQWQGIDGSTVFTHFPPIDTYNVSMQPAQLAYAERNYADHGGGTMSLAPFGYGNGGGGPTREMMERYRRMRDLEGLPRVDIASPSTFFDRAEADYPDAPVWVGELYFEMHRGTYTSQAKTKAGNRRTEILLGEVELWSTLAAAVAGVEYPYDDLEAAWRETLTLQFHDIIPGSSIAWVHDDAEATYARLGSTLTELRETALAALAPAVGGAALVANGAPVSRREVAVLDESLSVVEVDSSNRSPLTPAEGVPGELAPPGAQVLADGATAVWIEIDALSADAIHRVLVAEPEVTSVRVVRSDDGTIVDNGIVRLTIDANGLLRSIIDLRADRELLRPGTRGNVLELSDDHPIEYDAWDLDEYYAARTVELTEVDSVEVIDAGPLLARVRISRSFGTSSIVQDVVVRAGSARIDVVTDLAWHEDEKVLKVAWPIDVRTDRATCEIQFGQVERPTHTSTSWDAAKFEICAHRWIDVSEPDYGVALLNDAKYGHDVHRGALRLTLLRAAKYPDPDADRGDHHFTYSLFPHACALVDSEVVAEAARLNQPVVVIAAGSDGGEGNDGSEDVDTAALRPVSTGPGVVVSAVKLAEDGSGDIIVRMYEPHGRRVSTTVWTAFATTDVTVCDFLERPLAEEMSAARVEGEEIAVTLRPFQILTLRLS